MGRKHKRERFDDIYETVETYPGSRPSVVARLLGVVRSMITRALPAMNDEGYLLYEDEEGGLWPFQRDE